jgi:hypothetical protein
MRQLEITFTPHEIGRKCYKISDAADWIFSMNYGSLDTTLSKPSTPMLLTWDYTSDICRSLGGGTISWLTTSFRASSLMSTANDFLAGKGRRKFLVALAIILTSSYIDTCIKHLCLHGHRCISINVLNILTNILFEYDTFGILVRSRMTPKKTNLWISSRDMNFLSSRD